MSERSEGRAPEAIADCHLWRVQPLTDPTFKNSERVAMSGPFSLQDLVFKGCVPRPVDVHGSPNPFAVIQRCPIGTTSIRTALTGPQLARIAPHCHGRECGPERAAPDPRSGALDRPDRLPLARPAGGVRQVEHHLRTVPQMGEGLFILSDVQGASCRSRPRACHGRRRYSQGSPSRSGRKWGLMPRDERLWGGTHGPSHPLP